VGDKEFSVLLIDCNRALCNVITDQILNTVRTFKLAVDDVEIKFTVSVGAIIDTHLSSCMKRKIVGKIKPLCVKRS
jgi:GGDEF domain-containing protein